MADHARFLRARNALADGFQRDGAELATHLVNGALTVIDWAKTFAQLISHGVTAGFLLGKGTRALDERGASIVDGIISTQYGYAKGFVADVQALQDAGTLATAGDAIANRSGLYAGGSVITPAEIGRSDQFGIDLPYFPADGETPCMGNCRCAWSIVDDGKIITATWIAQDDEKTCDGCLERERAAPIEFATAA